jgi:hypothetical protein
MFCLRFCLEVRLLTLKETLERVNNEFETPAKEMVVPYAMNYATFRLDRLSETPDCHLTFDRGCNTPVAVAGRCKAWVCGRSFAANAGSNPVGDMDVCLLSVLCVVRYRSLRRTDHSPREVLPSVTVKPR